MADRPHLEKTMKLFTFGGMAFRLHEKNPGIKLGRFALAVRDSLAQRYPQTRPDYELYASPGRLNAERHFTSDINIRSITLDNPGGLLTLSARKVLDAESKAKSPVFANRMMQAAPPSDPEPVAILSHSQGTNNAAHTLDHLRQNHPEFFEGRKIFLVMLDTKASPVFVKDLYRFGQGKQLRMLFFQSEFDLLDSQEFGRRKFFMNYEDADFGDHIWVGGLGHDEIAYWNGSIWNDRDFGAAAAKERLTGDLGLASILPLMTQKRFIGFRNALIQRSKRVPKGAQSLGALQQIQRDLMLKYSLPNRRPADLLVDFLAGAFNPLPEIKP